MNADEYQYSLALTLLPGIGCVRAKQIIAKLGSAEAFFREKPKALRMILGANKEALRKSNWSESIEYAEKIVQEAFRRNHQILHYLEEAYPRRLKQIDDAPVILFGDGHLSLNTGRVVGIVGTRNATHYGRQVCEELIEAFHDKQITVVSGLALGIDGIAHQACVNRGIPTIGVLGHGLEMIYPNNHSKLADQMCLNGGLLTEFPYKTKPDAMNFPMRNRIVAGMCDAVVVIESDVKGGSLITCNLANDYGKEVFAVPGPVFSKYSRGCHKIIAENKAHIFTDARSFLETMNWSKDGFVDNKQLELWQELAPSEQGILQFLKEKRQASVDVLSVVQQIPLGQLSGLLLTLEIAGFVKALPGKQYALSDRLAS